MPARAPPPFRCSPATTGGPSPTNTITAAIPPSQDGSYRPAYETEGETSASVTVQDNDVAPKITLTASATTVVEGTAASFTMTPRRHR